ncbi:MAG: hypothetical protein CYG60_21305 [Actinobacteria bacterium]|nr:MAG: hypothetical protein CYG60_21305 [Actinomycetota bacterium]
MAMVEKLDLPFPLLSDAKGELSKLYDLWSAREGVAVPAILVIDRSGAVRYVYKGSDFADRSGDDPILETLDGMAGEEASSAEKDAPAEVSLSADEAEASTVRPERPPMSLEQLVPYYRGVYFTTVALKKRFAGMEPGGRQAFDEVDRYQGMTSGYMEAIRETRKQKSSR